MRIWRMLVAALVWSASVVTVATVAWFAIDSAGRQVVAQPIDVSPVVAGVAAAAASARPVIGPAAASSVPAPPPSSPVITSPVITGTPTPSASGQPGTPPGPGHSPRTVPDTLTPPTGQSSGTPAGPWAGHPVTASVTSWAGRVDAVCVGPQLSDWRAGPADGWGASATRPGPGQLKVLFTRNAAQVDVMVRCVEGRPRFTVSAQGGGD